MLCHVCKRSLEGVNDPTVTTRLQVVPQQDDNSDHSLFDIEKYVFGHHRTRDSLVQSIKQLCLLCVIFQDEGHNSTPVNDDYFTTFRLTVDESQLSIHLMCSGLKNWGTSFLWPLESIQKDTELSFELDDSTGGQHARKLIDEWDRNCLANHQQCGQIGNSAFLPTRLLDFEDVSNPTTCRLVLREEVSCPSKYTTLSYCWGTTANQGRLCLSQTTFNTLRTGLPVESLPKTYVDAIHVTARLGIRYIWIDALCIVQDSPQDWRSEASTMQAVYRNSYLTISAVVGAHNASGLFYPRKPVEVQPTVVNIAYSSCDKPKPFLHAMEFLLVHNNNIWGVGNVTTKRGWCLQERILPSRVLHFGAQQVFWECYENHACETIPASHAPRRKATRLWKVLLGEEPFIDSSGPYEDLFSEWYRMLSHYSSCQLTHASDKLVAISGLADDMKLALNTRRPGIQHTYVAGLWAEDLRLGLYWSLDTFGSRPTVYRAPSWSPMSLDGPMRWYRAPSRDNHTWCVGDADCTAVTHYENGLETGEVTDGKLELRGPWATLEGVTTATGGRAFSTRCLVRFPYLDPDSVLERPLVVEANAMVQYDTEGDMVDQAFCMPLYTRLSGKGRWSFRGIVLVQLDDGRSTCRRIGLAEGFFTEGEVAHTFFSQCPRRSVTVI